MMGGMKTVSVLGSTGSIGRQTLEVAGWRGYRVRALVAGRNLEALRAQAAEHRPELVVCAPEIEARLRGAVPPEVRVASGDEAAAEAASLQADSVVAAIPGMAGLAPTRAALRAGRHVALANKEAMVVAGPLMWQEARRHGARITPVDSEHSALHQALVGEPRDAVAALVLTASGGPFRDGPADLAAVTPAQALKHPTWSMGPKVTIDSATLFNKGLEVLEAHYLFDVPLDRIEVVIHPQSLVHGLVRFRDGSLKAQIGPHDMRLPIQYAIEAPARPQVPLEPLPLDGVWEFRPPDLRRFPALPLAYEAGRRGGTSPALLNAADEVAVRAFLEGRLRFDHIPELLSAVLDGLGPQALGWEALAEADEAARALAEERVARSAVKR